MTAVDSIPLSLSQPSLIKMEDRKRSMPYDQSDAPPLKRQATSANGAGKQHPDTDMPWRDDLEVSLSHATSCISRTRLTMHLQRYQKDAIYRQMMEYKREKNSLQKELDAVREKTKYHDDHIRAVDVWFKQLITEIKSMSTGDDDEDMDLSSLPTSLLFEGQPSLAQHISARTNEIRHIISRLLGRTKAFSPELTALQKQVSQLLAKENALSVESEGLRSDILNLEARFETATERYVVAERKYDRAKSAAVAKLEKQALMSSTKSEDTAVKQEETTNGVSESNEDYAQLEQEHKKLIATSDTLREQVTKLQEECSKFQTQVTEANSKAVSLNDEDFSKTELFKQFKAQHDDAVKKLNDLDARSTQLKDENRKLLQERTSYQNKLDDETRSTVAEKDNQVGALEKDLARIRTERDNLLADLNIRKATMEREHEAARKIKELNAAQEDRIKSLESETQRLQNATMANADDGQLDNISVEELRAKYTTLNQNYNMLSGELTAMSTAYQRASKTAKQNVEGLSAMEEKLQRLLAEKAKADQKYFAAMKSKETRDQEIRTLKMQTAKSSEVLLQVKEADDASRTLVANLEKQLAEMKDGHSSKTTECRSLQSDKTNQELEVARLNKQVADLKQQLEGKDTEVTTKSTACRNAEVTVSELQSVLSTTRKDLERWKSSSGQSEAYENLRIMLYCHCNKHVKDTVIKTCGHVMCSHCVDERVASRSRKCPRCSKSFGSNDYMRVTL